jgi:hypothetical protein
VCGGVVLGFIRYYAVSDELNRLHPGPRFIGIP